MVLNTIKYLLTGDNSSAEKEYNKILKNLSLNDENPEHKDEIKMLRDAFDIGYTAHKGQLRQSGEEYFSHCLQQTSLEKAYEETISDFLGKFHLWFYHQG